MILYLFAVSLISVLSFFHVIFGSCLPLQRHSILIDFCLTSLVIFGFSNAGAILSNCSKFALSPIQKKHKINPFHSASNNLPVTLITTFATAVPSSFDNVHL